MYRLIHANARIEWRTALAEFSETDATYLPEYHLAYALRVKNATPLMWHFSRNGEHFIYPYLLTPVFLNGAHRGHFDISSIYGYTGPLSSTTSPEFLKAAWDAFDQYCHWQKVVAEFVRFSPFHGNENIAHPETVVSVNRTLAISKLPGNEPALLTLLGAKTRNMLRKAQREGLVARELPMPQYLSAFRELYAKTMQRNQAAEFFWYDDIYWQHLLELGHEGLRLFATYANDQMVAASVAIAHGSSGLYHLGASLPEYARLGAGNLSLFSMSCGLMAAGVRHLNMTGGRTTEDNDPLLLFKRSNATETGGFYIGKRVIDRAAYNDLVIEWQRLNNAPPSLQKIIFWRP